MNFRKLIFSEKELCTDKKFHEYWKQMIYTFFTILLSVVNLPFILNGTRLFFLSGSYFGAILELSAYILFLFVVLNRRIPMKQRMHVLVYFLLFIASFLLFMTGGLSTWNVILMLSYVTAGFLFERRQLLFYSVINVLVFGLAALVIEMHWFPDLRIHSYHDSWGIHWGANLSAGFTILYLINITIVGIREQSKLSIDREEFLRSTINSNHDGIIIADIEGKITNINPSACKILGVTEAEMLNQGIDLIFSHIKNQVGEKIQFFDEFLLHSKGVLPNMLYSVDEKTLINLTLSYATIMSANEEIIGVIFSMHDTTNQKVLDDKLKQTQKLQALGTLAGGVAHDFNNMLGGIMGYAQLLERGMLEDKGVKEQEAYIREIIKTVEKASELTRQLLAYARKEEIRYRNLDINECIRSAVKLLNRTIDKKITITMNLMKEKIAVFGDETLLQNVFLNICLNARDAMPNGGRLTVHSRLVELGEIFVKGMEFDLKPGRYVKIAFTDSGKGIDPRYVDRIFEPFFTTKGIGEGTGLGLSESYGTIVAHSGAVIVQTELHKGTTFIIYLPASDQNEPIVMHSSHDHQDGYAKVVTTTNKRILLVDDEPVMRSVLELYLNDIGYDVYTADHGIKALEIFKKKSNEIDVVLLDMMMPKLNGAETFREMSKIRSDVKVILLSGYTDDEKIDELYEEGIYAFFKKPFRLEEIAECIESI